VGTFLQQLVNGLEVGSLYALIALGYTLIYGILHIVNFAHGEIYMLGAMAVLYLHVVAGLALVPTLVVIVALALLLGLCIERGIFREGRTRRHARGGGRGRATNMAQERAPVRPGAVSVMLFSHRLVPPIPKLSNIT